jgi:hypothetical protein
MRTTLEASVHPTPELVALIQHERELDVEHRRLARLAACAKACCSPSLIDRVVRAVRPSTASC